MGWNREYYDTLKSAGLCPRCKDDAQPGKVHCRPCLDYLIQTGNDYRESRRVSKARYRKKAHAERREEGRCTRFGCKNPRGTFTQRCDDCRRDFNLKYKPRKDKSTACGLCRVKGHDRRTCPLRPAPGTSSTLDELATARRECE